MSKRLSFSIAVNLLTENFKKGTNVVKNSLRSLQMQVLTFAAALGAGGLGISGLLSRFRDVARETSRVMTALKNVSNGTKGFTDNLRFVNDLANKYGLEINALVGNFAKFTASATQANMPMEQQKKVFESVSRAITAFGLSATESDGVMLALSQMMSKGKISMEELRKQMGEKLPVAIQAMAKALGVSIGEMEKLIGSGKVMSADVLPKFADALNEIIPNVDTDNLETSLSRLSNAFTNIVDSSGFQNKYKALIDGLTSLIQSASKNIQNIIVGIVAAIGFVVANGLTKVYRGYAATGQQIVANATTTHNKLRAAIAARVEAEKRLEELKLQHAQSIGRRQIALATQIERAKQTLSARTTQVNVAHENAKAAAAQAAAIKSRGAWATAGATISGSIKKLGVAIKSMWNSFSPAIIMSGIIALVGGLISMYEEAKRIKSIFSDYRKELDKVSHTEEIVQLNKLKEIAQNTNKHLEERQTALDIINKKLGTNYTIDKNSLKINGDINKQINERIGLLKAQANAQFLGTKIAEAEDKRRDLNKELERIENIPIKGVNNRYLNPAVDMKAAAIKKTKEELKQIDEVLKDANIEYEKAIKDGGLADSPTATTPNTSSTGDDKKAQRARKAAQKAVDDALKLKNDKIKAEFDARNHELESQQALLNLQEDGYEKSQKQIELNHQKELLGIARRSQELIEVKQKAERDEWDIQNPNGTKTPYIAKTNSIQDLSSSAQAQIITDDDIANKQQEKANADLLKSLIDKYQDYNTRRIKLEKDYNEEIDFLESKRNETNSKAIDAATAELIKQRDKALSSINLEEFQDSIDWSSVFGNLDKLSTSALEGVREKLRKYLEEAGNSLSPTDLQTVTDSLEKMNLEISDRKPITELKSSYDVYKKSLVEVIAAKEKLNGLEEGTPEYTKATKELSDAEKKRRASLTGMSQSINSFGQKGNQLVNSGNEIIDMLGAFGVEVDENVSKTLQGAGQVMSGLENIDLTKPFSIITSTITMITGAGKAVAGIFGLFGGGNKNNERYQQMKEQYESLNKVWDELISKKKEYISISYGEEARKVGEEAQRLTEKQIDSNRELGKAYMNSFKNKGGSSWGVRQQSRIKGDDWNDLASWKKLNNISDDLFNSVTTGRMTGLFDLTAEQLESLKEEAPSLWAKLEDQTKEYLNNIIDGADRLEDINKSLKEQYTQLSLDSFKDNYVDMLSDMDSSNQDFADNFEKYIQKAILSSLIGSKYKSQIESLYDDFANANANGDIDATEAAALKKKQDELAAQMLADREKLKESLGWKSDSSKSQDSTKGYSVSMDQDTGGAILGRITGIHEAILTAISMISSINVDTAKSLTQFIVIGDELKKHTGIFYEMQQMQVKSFNINKEMKETLGALGDIKSDLASINKNTKGLAPR